MYSKYTLKFVTYLAANNNESYRFRWNEDEKKNIVQVKMFNDRCQ